MNHLAVGTEPLSYKHILQVLKPQFGIDDLDNEHTDAIKKLLNNLVKDHYLQRQPSNGNYLFEFALVKRWWVIAEELS